MKPDSIEELEHVDVTIDLNDLIALDGEGFTELVDDATYDKFGSGSLTNLWPELEATYPMRPKSYAPAETQLVIRVYGTLEGQEDAA